MKLLVVSDLHLEFHRDHGNTLFRKLGSEADTLVIAGDFTTCSGLLDAFDEVCAKYENVVYVLGNHEFYGGYDYMDLYPVMNQAMERNPNLHWLENGTTEINGQRFIGGALWFRDCAQARANTHWLNDFRSIKGFKDWVYEKNLETISYLEENVREDDIVVTHHLPSPQSTPKRFRGNDFNCYFVCDMEPLIAKVQPKLWVHGHTHDSCDYKLGETRVVCNPFGYVGYETNGAFNKKFFVEV